MKKLLFIILISLMSINICFAFTAVPKIASETAKIYLQPGQHLHDMMIDATGFAHGIEMNVPGTAYVTNVTVKNAGQPEKNNGRGIIAFGVGVHIIVNGTLSRNNSEDGFRAINGAKMTILNSRAANNKILGFFVGAGSSMTLIGSEGVNSEHGFMAVEEFVDVNISGGRFWKNSEQGMQFWEGENVTISNAIVDQNSTAGMIIGGLEGVDNRAGIAIHGVKNVAITDTQILDNYQIGLISASNTFHPGWPKELPDAPTRLIIERVTITGHPEIGVLSEGDSVVTILNSTLEGTCVEAQDIGGTNHWGIITVDGKSVEDDQVCP